MIRSRTLGAWAGAVLCAVAVMGARADDAMQPEDFAYRWPLEIGDGDFHRVQLPLEVYAAASAPDLADVRVLDARGRPAPRFLHLPDPEERDAPDPRKLQVFAVGQDERDADVVSRMAIEARIGGAEAAASLSIASAEAGATRAVRWIALIDEPPVTASALRIAWSPRPDSFVGAVRLDTSGDLAHWRSAGEGALAGLAAPDGYLARNRVALREPLARYLRVTPRNLPEGFAIDGLELHFDAPPGDAAREWHATPLHADGTALELDLGAAVPVDRFDVVTSAPSGALHARLYARAAPDEEWRLREQGLFYRLENTAGGLTSSPQTVARGAARYWKLELAGGLASSGELRLGWRPVEVVFIAQGERPLRLYAGSARHARAPAQLAAVDAGVARLWSDDGGKRAASAALGARETVSGDAAYAVRSPDAWKRWSLWALLAAGVGLVAWMAWRVARDLRADSGRPPAGEE